MVEHKKNKASGITLIALVITIIVLLILAGISIQMLTGDNGILTRAGEAKDTTEEKSIDERVKLAYLAALTGGKGEATEWKLKQELNKEFGENGYQLSEDLTKVTIDNKEYLIVGTVQPGGITIEDLQTETTKPYLPTGFNISSKEDEQSVSKGLVITDGTNQFVWVEVPMTEAVYQNATRNIIEFTDAEYLKIAKDLVIYSGSTLSNNPTSLADHLPPAGNGIPDYTSDYKDMLKSVYQNGGFYVGRYETGIQGTENATTSARTAAGNTTQVAVIKENVQPYTYITWGQAQTLAQGISSGDKKSGLPIGMQWDLMLRFIGKDGDTNSTDWGNYRNSVFNLKQGSHYAKYSNYALSNTWKAYNVNETGYVVSSEKKSQSSNGNGILCTTGANTEKNSKKNICDIAGNVWECTREKTSPNLSICSIRGGHCNTLGSGDTAFFHYGIGVNDNASNGRISCFNILS